jgi:hypothetical protein
MSTITNNQEHAKRLAAVVAEFDAKRAEDPSIIRDAEGAILYGNEWQRYCSTKPLARHCSLGQFGHVPLKRDLPVIIRD